MFLNQKIRWKGNLLVDLFGIGYNLCA